MDNNMERDAVERAVDSKNRHEVVETINEMKTEKATGPSDI